VGLLVAPAFATDNTITRQKTTATIAASGVGYSQPLKLTGKHGFFSVQTVLTGSGTLKIEYELSNSTDAPQTWSEPDGATDIASGLTAGTTLYQFEPETVALWLRLKFTETGTANTVTYTTRMAMQ